MIIISHYAIRKYMKEKIYEQTTKQTEFQGFYRIQSGKINF